MGDLLRIAIFTTDDMLWALPTWGKTIPKLQEHHTVVGLWQFPDRLGKHRGGAIPLWYLRVFGFWTVLGLALFSFKQTLQRFSEGLFGWGMLSRQSGVPIFKGTSPNDSAVLKWVQDEKIDVLFIMVGDILKPPILTAPKLGVINKHAALLPSGRGVFPFFWATLSKRPLGVTFHQVDAGIDSGPLLVQKRYPSFDERTGMPFSMLGFYCRVFEEYPDMACQAVEKLRNGHFLIPDKTLKPGYDSFPTRDDYRAFRRHGGQIITGRDFFLLHSNRFSAPQNIFS